jgi:hypothetical protein
MTRIPLSRIVSIGSLLCAAIAILCMVENTYAEAQLDDLSVSHLERVVGAGEDMKCHHRCFIPDCGFQTFACKDLPFDCDIGTEVAATPISAICKPGMEGQNCDLDTEIEIKYYKCRIKAGAKNNAECSQMRWRCPIENLKTPLDDDPPKTKVDIEKATSTKCSSSPPFEDDYLCKP